MRARSNKGIPFLLAPLGPGKLPGLLFANSLDLAMGTSGAIPGVFGLSSPFRCYCLLGEAIRRYVLVCRQVEIASAIASIPRPNGRNTRAFGRSCQVPPESNIPMPPPARTSRAVSSRGFRCHARNDIQLCNAIVGTISWLARLAWPTEGSCMKIAKEYEE